MTMVAALAATDGVVCIGDGSVFNSMNELINHEETKLFELSPYCVIMPNGSISANIAEVMAFIKETIKKYQNDNVNFQNPSFIANQLADAFREMNGVDNQDPYGFIIAGIETFSDGEKAPMLINLESTDWQVKIPKEPFVIGGVIEPALTTIRDGYGKPNDRIRNVNRLSLKAMQETIKASGVVGGKVSLWNVTEKGVKVYDQRGLEKLMRDL